MSFKGIFPDETLALAEAIAERSMEDEQAHAQIELELTGLPLALKPEVEARQANLGRTLLLLAAIEDPGLTLDFQDFSNVRAASGEYRRAAGQLSDMLGLTFDEEAIRSYQEVLSEESRAGSQVDAQYTTELFARELAAVRQLAAERKASVLDIYADDEQYFEAQRRAYSLTDIATLFRRMLQGHTPDVVMNTVVRTLETAAPEEMRGTSMEEFNEIAIGMQLDPEAQLFTALLAEISQETIRQFFVYEVVKVWGVDCLAALSADDQDTLLPKTPWTTPILSALEAQVI